MCNNNLAFHDWEFSHFSTLLHNLLLKLHKRNENFPKSKLGQKYNLTIIQRNRQIAEGKREEKEEPAGQQMNITSYVLAANLGPIIVFKMALKHLECE